MNKEITKNLLEVYKSLIQADEYIKMETNMSIEQDIIKIKEILEMLYEIQ